MRVLILCMFILCFVSAVNCAITVNYFTDTACATHATTPATDSFASSAGSGNGAGGVVLQETGAGGVLGGACVSATASGSFPATIQSVKGICNSIGSGGTTTYTSDMSFYTDAACSVGTTLYSSTLSTTNCQTLTGTTLNGVGSIQITCNSAFGTHAVNAFLILALIALSHAASKIL